MRYYLNHPPPRPLEIAAKSHRALYREAKKAGALDAAERQIQTLVQLRVATENDQKLLAKLQGAVARGG